MAPSFDVLAEHLATGSTHLAEDSTNLSAGCTSGVSEAGVALDGVNGGPLSVALAAFSVELDQRGATMVDALAATSRTLIANAAQYVADDTSARDSLRSRIPE